MLGEHQINIANFALGRSDRSPRVPLGNALAVIQIDGEGTEAVLASLRKAEGITQAQLVHLDQA